MQKLHSFRIPSWTCSSVRRPCGCALPARALPQLIPPLVAAALVRLVGLLPSILPTLLRALPAQEVTVLSIGDVDTLRVVVRGCRHTIRLACINAPEMTQGPYVQQSQAMLRTLAHVGSDVSLKIQDTERYGREPSHSSTVGSFLS
jgi:endonuclease YncB( thermonuclease family)